LLLRVLSLLGRYEEALDLLEELVHSGWRGGGYEGMIGDLRFNLYRNVLLDAIRDHPRFQAMVAVIESDMAEQLENVREMERKGELPTLEDLRAELAAE
jgi:pentatricopeptide repeat protein